MRHFLFPVEVHPASASSRTRDQPPRPGEVRKVRPIDFPVLPGVDDRPDVDGVGQSREAADSAKHRRVGRVGALHLEQPESAAGLDGEIRLDAGLVAHVVEARASPAVELGLEGLHDDEVLEQPAQQRIARHLPRRLDLEEVRGEPDVGEVDLGGLHEPLAEVVVVRLEPVDDEARLKDGQPLPDGSCADPHLARKAVQVDHLPDAARQEPEEQLEEPLPREVHELADVPLDVGPVVGLVGVHWILPPVVDRGEEAPEDVVVAPHSDSRAGELLDRQRVEGQERGAAGQRLGDPLLEPGLVRSREDVAAVSAVRVNGGLNLAQQLWHALDLVDDRGGGEAGEEPTRVALREGPHRVLLKVGVGVVRERRPRQGRLSALPGALNRNDWERPRQFNELVGYLALYHTVFPLFTGQ